MRNDIQTLRAVAVLLVLLWHAGVPGVAGGYVGVDVFFVISGFLMTQIILSELVERRRVDLPAFYLRRVRRLFPAAAVALAGTIVITVTMLPITRWREVAGDIAASGIYLVNWRLAERSVDYLASDSAPSPVQHFWSLAVEEQFYLVWPVALTAAVVLSAPRGRHHLPQGHLAVAWLAGALATASLLWSAWLTQADPGRAYFVTTTRLWELALGGVVAALWPVWTARFPRPAVAGALVLGGLGAIAASATLFETTTPFPGVAALLPTLGTAAVLLGGPFVHVAGPAAHLLGLRPALWVGGLSYSLYLWHWPMLVGVTAVLDQPTLPWPVGLAVVVASLGPAWLSLHHVEARFRGRVRPGSPRLALARVGRWVGGYAAVTGACALALVAATSLLAPGGLLGPRTTISPALEVASQDVYAPFYDGCDPLSEGSPATLCVGGAADAEQSVVLVGDSHAVMWMSALDAAARERGWRAELMAMPSCPAADVVPMVETGPRTQCGEWREAVVAELSERPRDAVITAQVPIYGLSVGGEVLRSEDAGPAFSEGLVRSWQQLEGTGAAVVSMAPTPRFRSDRVECVAENLRDLGACGEPASVALEWTQQPVDAALPEAPWVHTVDLNHLICPDGTCPAVDEGVLVFSDTNHLTRTRLLQLAAPLGDALAPVMSGAPVRAGR